MGGAIDADLIASESPWQQMARVVPIRLVPEEMLREAMANLKCPEYSVSQVVYASDLFGAIVAGGQPRAETVIDMHREVACFADRARRLVGLSSARLTAVPILWRLRRGQPLVDTPSSFTDH